jgi:hypothetical protein
VNTHAVAVVERPQELVGGNPGQVRLTIEEQWGIAQFLSASRMFQNKGQNMTNEECMVVVMMGQGLGIPPAVAMLNIHMIDGRPSMAAELLGYFIKSSGRYDYRSVHQRDENGDYVSCTVTVYDTASGEACGESTYTLRDAERAGLIKPRSNWEKHPGAMLHARAISQALRWHCPDAIPIRPYALDEIEGPASGVVAVDGETKVSVDQVQSVVDAALTQAEETEEVEVAAADVTEPEPSIGDWEPDAEPEVQDADIPADPPPAELFDPATEPAPEPVAPPPYDQEGILREDLKHLGLNDKRFIKDAITERGWEFGWPAILQLMGEHHRIGDWLAANRLAPGVVSRETGSQTGPVISDRQLGLLHARFGECNFSDQDKKVFLKRYAQVESSRQVQARDFDELLGVLTDIKNGDDGTRRAYLGGDE